jgi:hypothetical protein
MGMTSESQTLAGIRKVFEFESGFSPSTTLGFKFHLLLRTESFLTL